MKLLGCEKAGIVVGVLVCIAIIAIVGLYCHYHDGQSKARNNGTLVDEGVPFARIYVRTVRGHDYVVGIIDVSRGISIVHAESCPCKERR